MGGDALAIGVMALAMAVVACVDLRERRIPDAVSLPATAVVLALRMAWGGGPWWHPAAWAIAVCAVLLVPALLRPSGMGMGDAKVALLMGAAMGALALPAVLLALAMGAVGGAAWGLARRVPVGQVAMPFAPFLLVGAVAVLLPVGFVHSAHARGPHHHHASHAGAPVRPAHVGIGGIWRHQAVGRTGAAGGAGHARRPGAGGGRPAP